MAVIWIIAAGVRILPAADTEWSLVEICAGIVHAAVAPVVLLMVILGVLGGGGDSGKLGRLIDGTFAEPAPADETSQ